MDKKRYTELDILRIIAFTFVMLQHAIAGEPFNKYYNGFPNQVDNFIFKLTDPAVPIFFFLSGFSLIYIYKDKPFNIKGYYLNRFKTIILPYLICSF